MKRHIFTNIALALGCFTFFSAFASGANPINLEIGIIIILFSLSCKSANKRRLKEVAHSSLRLTMEWIPVALTLVSWLLLKNPGESIANNPIPMTTAIISIIFYLIAFIRALSNR
jgi:hypothetical protein